MKHCNMLSCYSGFFLLSPYIIVMSTCSLALSLNQFSNSCLSESNGRSPILWKLNFIIKINTISKYPMVITVASSNRLPWRTECRNKTLTLENVSMFYCNDLYIWLWSTSHPMSRIHASPLSSLHNCRIVRQSSTRLSLILFLRELFLE